MSKLIAVEKMRDEIEKIMAEYEGYHQGRGYIMSQPNEPRFEDDFDCDTDPPDLYQYEYEYSEGIPMTLTDIAITKAHAFAQEYNPSTGRVEDKPNYHALKEGYMAGFLEGFAHRLTQPTGE